MMDNYTAEMEALGQVTIFDIVETEEELVVKTKVKKFEDKRGMNGKLTGRSNGNGYIEPRRTVIKVR